MLMSTMLRQLAILVGNKYHDAEAIRGVNEIDELQRWMFYCAKEWDGFCIC